MRNQLEQRIEFGLETVAEELGAGDWRWRILGENREGPNVFEFRYLDRCVIGKFHQDDLGERSHTALIRLGKCDFEFLSVPVPIVFNAAQRFLLSESAEGCPFDQRDLGQIAERLSRVGCALRELHESGVYFGPPKQLADHTAELINPPPERFTQAFREFAPVVEHLLQNIADHDHDAVSLPCVPLHRDFHLRQLFDTGCKIGVVDWDLCAQGDPAFDVAYFVTYLSSHLEAGMAAVARDGFMAGYRPSDELSGRLDLYENFNYLRRSCRRLRLQDVGWKAEIDWMMQRLSRRLLD